MVDADTSCAPTDAHTDCLSSRSPDGMEAREDGASIDTQPDADVSRCEAGDLTCVRAAFQRAITACADGDTGPYETIHAAHPSPAPSGFGVVVIDSGAYLASMTRP